MTDRRKPADRERESEWGDKVSVRYSARKIERQLQMERKERCKEKEKRKDRDIARERVRDCQRERKTNKHNRRQIIEREETETEREI
jgi:hypothetical protein